MSRRGNVMNWNVNECTVNTLKPSEGWKLREDMLQLFLNEQAVLASMMHGSAQSPTILYSNASVRSRAWRKTQTSRQVLPLFTLVAEQTTVCKTVLSCLAWKSEVWTAWEVLCCIIGFFVFIHLLHRNFVSLDSLLCVGWIFGNILWGKGIFWNDKSCALNVNCSILKV